MRFARGLSNLFCHQARSQPSRERQNRAREARNNHSILIRQIFVSRQAVEKGESVSELDADLVVAEAPERFASGISAFSLSKVVAFSGSVLLVTAGFRSIDLLPDLDLGGMKVVKRSKRHKANAVIAPLTKNNSTNHADWKIENKHTNPIIASLSDRALVRTSSSQPLDLTTPPHECAAHNNRK